MDVKREITYSAYIDNLENTVKLLTASKLVKLSDDVRRKIFVTSQATRREHFEFFGKTKAIIYENLENTHEMFYQVKKQNFIDRAYRA